jgi:D-lactate dehydrogenase
MNIHYFSGEPWEEKYVREKLPNDSITFHPGPLGDYPELTDPTAEALCVFIETKIGEAEMSRFPALKLITTRSTGFDHIDLAAAKARNVTVTNIPFYGENTVAEFAFALLLALSRRIIEADERVRSGTFSPKDLRGFDLAGKTLGIVGCGHIGMHMAEMAHGFGMKLIGFELKPDLERGKALGLSYVPLADLLSTADIITLHLPYNVHTHHIINRDNLSTVKKGAYLINTARGALVDTDALVDALKSGILAGAGLDVLEDENDLADTTSFLSASANAAALKTTLENHYLISHPRVIVTPHLAFNTQEAVLRITDATIENIQKFGAGAPTNVVAD